MRTRGLSRASGHVCDSGSLGESGKGSVLGVERHWYQILKPSVHLLVMIFFLNYRQVLLKVRKPQSGSLDVPLCHLSVHNKLCGYLNIHRESQGQEKRKEKKEE